MRHPCLVQHAVYSRNRRLRNLEVIMNCNMVMILNLVIMCLRSLGLNVSKTKYLGILTGSKQSIQGRISPQGCGTAGWWWIGTVHDDQTVSTEHAATVAWYPLLKTDVSTICLWEGERKSSWLNRIGIVTQLLNKSACYYLPEVAAESAAECQGRE